MNVLLNKAFNKLGIASSRTKNIARHIGWSLVFKGGSILANFMMVPLAINYLSTEKYGIWLTLTSFIGWFSIFDIGLGNGLRNKFAEAKAVNDVEKAKGMVSTAYFTIGIMSMALFLLFFIANFFIDWTKVFNTSDSLRQELEVLMPLVFGFFALQLIAKLITSVYLADQSHSIQDRVQFFTQTSILLAIWLITKTGGSTLLLFGTLFSALPVLVLVALNFIAFNGRFRAFKPEYKTVSRNYFKDITGLGFRFFLAQLTSMVMCTTDNFIISHLFDPKEVVPFNVAFKYFSIITLGYSILITPFWSSFTDAYAKKDFVWIKRTINNIQKIWLLIPIGLLGFLLCSNIVYSIWLRNSVDVPINLSITVALYVLLMTFFSIYVYFINGVGKITVQLISTSIGMILNIPISIFFASYLDFGIVGVPLGTCFSVLIAYFIFPIQYRKIINGKAKGIWDK